MRIRCESLNLPAPCSHLLVNLMLGYINTARHNFWGVYVISIIISNPFKGEVSYLLNL